MVNSCFDSAKNAFLHHRLRVRCAKALVDHQPPLLHTRNFSRFSKLKEDVFTFNKRVIENGHLLVAINKITRTRGEIDSYRTADNCLTPNYDTSSYKRRLIEALDTENMFFGKKILCTKPDLNPWLEDRFKRKVEKKKPSPFEYPTNIMSKYSKIDLPKEPVMLAKFFRPKIWFNLEVKGIRPLGRIVMELYTEAAPQVVLEFVRLCFAQNKERLKFVRLYSRLWLEGEIPLDENTLIRKNIEFDKRSLDHGQYPGVLSFNIKTLKFSQKNVLNFSISFKPLSVCNGRRVGFGHVCEGLKVLTCIADYGTKNGKPTKDIVVSSCGLIK